MNKGIIVWGYLASLILLLGAVFAYMGFIAGKVLFLVGFLAFNFGYLVPLFYVIFKENQENKIGIFLLFGILGFLTFLTGISFYAVSWGGGIVLIYVGGSILVLAILTMIIVSRRFYETTIYSWFPVLVFGVFIVVSLLASTVNRQVMRVFNLNNKQHQGMVKLVQKQNHTIYNYLQSIDTNYQSNVILIQNAKVVFTESEKLNRYIEYLKLKLIANVEGDKYKFFESKGLDNLFPIQSNVEINSVNRVMLKNEKQAYVLKDRLDNYKTTILNIISPNDTSTVLFLNTFLNVESYNLSRRRYNKSWELQNFYDFPLVAVIAKLTSIQMQIVLVEKELLQYLQQQIKV